MYEQTVKLFRRLFFDQSNVVATFLTQIFTNILVIINCQVYVSINKTVRWITASGISEMFVC